MLLTNLTIVFPDAKPGVTTANPNVEAVYA